MHEEESDYLSCPLSSVDYVVSLHCRVELIDKKVLLENTVKNVFQPK